MPALDRADPGLTVWAHRGQPMPELRWRADGRPCVRCTAAALVTVRLTDVVSDKFTGWDAYPHADADPRWCPGCAWIHLDPAFRQHRWLITTEMTLGDPTEEALRPLFAAALADTVAVLLPQTRKKHMLPHAAWGQVTVDDRNLPWGSREADRLNAYRGLLGYGFNTAAITEPVPRFEQFRLLDHHQRTQTWVWWEELEAWRRDDVWLFVAAQVTRPTRTPKTRAGAA